MKSLRYGVRMMRRSGAVVLLGLLTLSSHASTLTWTGGVAGVWQSGGGGWSDSGSPALWNSATPDAAIFGSDSAGSVTVDSVGVTSASISVTSAGYVFDGTGPLVLNGAPFSLDAGVTAQVNAAISGNGFTKSGGGLLILSGTNKTYAGSTSISGGVVRVFAAGAGALGLTATQGVTLAGGRLEALFSANTTPSNVFTVSSAGGELRNLGNDSQRWIINGSRFTGSGEVMLSYGTNNTRYQILSGQNSFSGTWILDSVGNQNCFVDLFVSSAFGGATGVTAITLRNAGTVALRDKVSFGSATQGITLAGSGQARISQTGGSTGTVAGALSGSATNALQLFTENAGSLLIVSNTANSWLGETTLAGSGIVRLGAAGVFPDAGGNVVINSGVTLDLNGFDEAIGGLFGSGRVDTRASGAITLTVGGNNNSPTFSGSITNSGSGSGLSLVKVGSGTQTLSGTNTITGFVSVDAGTLALSGPADLAASTSLTVKAGATLLVTGRNDGSLTVAPGQVLTGDGAVIGIVSNRGVVAPDGLLMQTGNFAQAASGSLRITIAGASTFDALRSSGSASLNGALDVGLDTYTPSAGDAFLVFRSASRTGSFATTNLPSLSAGLGWVVSYLSTGVVLAVTGAPPATGYDAWAGSITNGLTNYYESATGDGYPNLLKYATGSSPTTPDLLARVSGVLATGTFSLVFNRDTNAVDVTLVVKGRSTMSDEADWTGVATNIGGVWLTPGVVETGTGNLVQVTVPDPVIGESSRFLQLNVSRP